MRHPDPPTASDGSWARAARAGAAAAVFAGLAAVVTACGPSKSAQCSEIITLVNDATKRLEDSPIKPDASRADKLAALRAMVAGMAKVADDLSKVPTAIPELKEFSTRYQKLARDLARLGTEMADAAEKGDIERQNLAKEQLDKVTDAEGQLVASVNEYCKGN